MQPEGSLGSGGGGEALGGGKAGHARGEDPPRDSNRSSPCIRQVAVTADVNPRGGQSGAHTQHWGGKETPWPVDALLPFRYPYLGGGAAASDLPGTADTGVADLPMPINRPYVAPYSAEFRHQAVLLTRSRNVPVSHVVRELGISIDSLRDWIAQARHDPRQLHQLHEGTSETVQAELVRLRADNRLLLREIAILRDALRIVASEGISAEWGRR